MWNDEGSSDAFNQKSEIKDGKHKSDKIDNELNIAPMFENLNLNAYGSADIKPKEVVKPQMKPAVDIKPNDLHELASSFSKKTMAAESKFININVFDSDGQKCVLEVRNKAPIPASIIERMVDRVSFKPQSDRI